MLKIQGLTKTYQGKDGNDVHALRGIDLSFPSKGMVFVLGKSGSGKSTLLNLLGGLDSPTSGTIEIDGNEIATFSRRDLDSYRNQYVGFVFQEYNVLDDFTVFDNVALALRLQNQEGNQEIVAKTLELVGLSGMEKRKANTLSGGQKQRVAIARAIVKNPEIVLADEPTGALDSTTGAEVLDVLKKLSSDKLVVVVSHDREYALRYGDRIIEIADGEIIHDTDTEGNKCPSNIAAGTDGSLCIADCESLSEEDIGAIVETLKKHRGKAALSFGDSAVPFFIAPSAESEEKKTAEPVDFSENKEKIAAKPNRLPLGTAIKMGATSLKKKPIRAALVCLLISLALGVFGIASSLMLYDTAFSIAATARNKNLDTSNVRKKYECTTVNHVYSAATGALIDQASHNPNPTSTTSMSAYFSVSEVEKLNARPSGLRFAGVYGVNLGSSDGALYFKDYKGNRTQYGKGFFGITDCGKEFMEQSGFTLVAGDYPTDANQIAISRFTFDCYKGTRKTPATAKDFVGKNIPFQVNDGTNRTITLTISGIYNTGDLPARYEAALDGFGDSKTNQELREYLYASFHRLAYVSPSFYETHGFAAKSLNHYMNYVNLACSNLIYGYDNASTPETSRTTYSFSPAEYVEKAGIPLSYEDEAGNPIEYVRPGDGECYLPISFPTSRDQEAAREYATRSLYALAHYESSPFLKELLPDETAINEAKEAAARVNQYPRQADETYEEDVAAMKKIGGKGYEETYSFAYLLSKARYFIAGYERENPNPPYLTGYEDFKAEVELASANDPAHVGEESRTKIRSFLQENIGDYLIHQETVVMANQIAEGDVSGLLPQTREALFLADATAIKENPALAKEKQGISFRQKIIDLGIKPESFGFIHNYGYDETDLVVPVNENPDFIYRSTRKGSGSWKVLGYFRSADPKADVAPLPIVSMEFLKKASDFVGQIQTSVTSSPYEPESDPKYDSLLCKTSYRKADIAEMLEKSPGYYYEMTDVAYTSSKRIVEGIDNLKYIFLAAGIGLGIFAVLMLLHFVSNSIASKTKQIGILRAVGARGSDLFKIFFAETGILLLICLAVSLSLGFLITWILNMSLLETIGVIVLEFGVIHSLILVGLTLGFAFLGTFFPVNSLARKAPIDSIREL